jgi:phosphopantetheine--protein transferase-like protein
MPGEQIKTIIGGGIQGIGIDLVNISTIREMIRRTDGVFVAHTFSEREREDAGAAPDEAAFYAGRFAVKEAVFKALAHLTAERTFDFRIVESQRMADGRPELIVNATMARLLEEAGADGVLISLSHEGDFAIAIAQTIKK